MYILLIGSGAREHAIARVIKKSPQNPALFCFGSSANPGIKSLSDGYQVGKITDPTAILNFAREQKIELAFIGPEAPLAAGVSDILWNNQIPCVGPKQKLAQLESSKGFTRDLQAKYQIPGQPRYARFNDLSGAEKFLRELGENNYVVKADGLMGGKGVKVAGEHLNSIKEALEYCQELVEAASAFVIEEKLIGQEFSLMSFCDGAHLAHMPPVQDHKRAFDNDLGPNTGGMGSYSCSDHLLPFLTEKDVKAAQKINQATAAALKKEFSENYQGILYGGFMVTKTGVKLIEYNARFGDPEAMNVLSILSSDFVKICQAIVNGNLDQSLAVFENLSTVCKYAVPEGYPDNPVKNQRIDVSQVQNPDNLYFGSVDERSEGLFELGSRAVAIVGQDQNLFLAEQKVEQEINRITGPLFHRRDIGTKELIDKKVSMMKKL